jgi:hypothetical protein
LALLATAFAATSDTPPARAGEADIPIIEGVPPGYELVRLTDDPTRQYSVPDINNNGDVIFGSYIPGTDDWTIQLFSDGWIRHISPYGSLRFSPVINDALDIAWFERDVLKGPESVSASFNGQHLQPDVDLVGRPHMNDHGDVVWSQRIQEGVSEFDVYLYRRDEGTLERITDGGNNHGPHINNKREVIWTLYDFSASPWIGHIMLYSSGKVRQITPAICECQGPDINDSGVIVWQDSEGVQVWDGESLTTIGSPASTPRINESGEIAFALWFEDENTWKHAVFKDGVVYVLPNFGLWTFRSTINDRAEMAMKSISVETGQQTLFLLRRLGAQGDFNHDCHVDLYDLWIMQRCSAAPATAGGTFLADCIRGDFDDDGDIDSMDWQGFHESFTGPLELIPTCSP